jgi:hypothetical protein
MKVRAGRLCGSQILSSSTIEKPWAENNQHFDWQMRPVPAVADTVDVHQRHVGAEVGSLKIGSLKVGSLKSI